MDDRKLFILGAILRSYIHEGKPIGSRTLQRDYQMDISAATIRNEMSDLEHDGYLMKSHTSSGRIPSVKAYRWYVNELLDRGFRSDTVLALGRQSLIHQSQDPSHLLDAALTILSEITDCVAFAVIPARQNDVLSKVRLIPVSGREILVVTVFDTKFVQTQLVRLSMEYRPERLERAGDILQELFEGKPLTSILGFFEGQQLMHEYTPGNAMSELTPVLREQIEKSMEPRLLLRGLNRLFRITEQDSMEDAFAFTSQLQKDPHFLEFLSDQDEQQLIHVFIGQENPIDYLKQYSLISVPYRVKPGLVGYIGTIGPMRMHYREVMSEVQRMGRYVDSITAVE
ncbi:MAG: heat-inducible transcriptional repressor HrcA [Peptoniphilaceae bacterium]|nr:heat-inducible transcriptional repressor HrcA [Peptoniphilaceae bacterium]MDD7434337.1 heat-inducible transcriptional repressor HrcA [Peptoniphilaceae bacterium]MDY3076328.1 heat-inducible transcriptional repressor HrcA [Peptoniphilaceae bacterium]MDY4196989.1 heat-inducible transcriptional repressor HrcA [Peptoniphilaceae bacterium]MDY5841377.1 heat-inducible transcriptional repressor HrcA [Peptoniphilaceae bacterium]